jgi:hypothetical protein
MRCLFSKSANSTGHSKNRQVVDRGIFVHLLFSSFRPQSNIKNPASTAEGVEMAVRMRIVSGADAEDQEVHFEWRKEAGQSLAVTVKGSAAK